MSAIQDRLQERLEGHVRYGEVHYGLSQEADEITQAVIRNPVPILRAMLRLARRDGVKLRHGTVKHCRDHIRYIEKARVRGLSPSPGAPRARA